MGHTRQGAPATSAPASGPARTGSVFFSFAPWIVFGLVAGPGTWEYAAPAALAAAVVLSGRDMLQGRFHLLDMAGIVLFAVLSVLGPTPSGTSGGRRGASAPRPPFPRRQAPARAAIRALRAASFSSNLRASAFRPPMNRPSSSCARSPSGPRPSISRTFR